PPPSAPPPPGGPAPPRGGPPHAVLNPTDADFEARVVELTGGTGPQVVFECAAAPSTLEQGLDLCARGGQVVMIAIAWESTPVVPPNWMAREVRMQSSFGTLPEDWRIALDLMCTGRVSVEPMLSATNFVPLEDIQGAFEALCRPSTELQMVVQL
ncbi:MAG: zinc-binding dehydrogenase, partial [Chloroflexi bacterium]|nr:zinc-binding dehydrogenase [Chloroflexota bacterium]